MTYEKRIATPILYDYNENGRGRVDRFQNYLKSLNWTKEDNCNRVTTSNGEFFYYEHMVKGNLPEGDYFYNGILFEFKSKSDLMVSIPERLDKQIDNVLKLKEINQYIIISNCLKEMDFTEKYDCEIFENLKNYFNQYVPFHIHFIPATSETICFRDMINIWRCQQSPLNLHTLNHRYTLNPFLNNLAILPCLNHNQCMAIFKKFPYTNGWDILNLTKNELADVKFGKKRCGEKKAEEIINQIQIRFGYYNFLTELNDIDYRNEVWENIKQGGIL